MDNLIDAISEHSGAWGFAALFLLKAGEMVWNWFRARQQKTDDTLGALTSALKDNTDAQVRIEGEMRRLKHDLRRCFFALKKISGDSWEEIMDAIRDDERKKKLNPDY